jgi:hypothetical protein
MGEVLKNAIGIHNLKFPGEIFTTTVIDVRGFHITINLQNTNR